MSGEIGKGPDEDEQSSRHVARGHQRQSHRPEFPPAVGPHALRGLLEGGVDLAEGVHHVEGDHGEEMEGLHEHHPVDPVEKVDGLEHVEDVHEEDIGQPEHERLPQRAQVEDVVEEGREIGEGDPSRLVGDRVVEDAGERVHEEDSEEEPDQAYAQRPPERRTPTESSHPRPRRG